LICVILNNFINLVILIWGPGHTDVQGNEIADELAQQPALLDWRQLYQLQ
jgi:ribonuclease HI